MAFPWPTFLATISGAIVGGAVSGFFVLRASNKSFDQQRTLIAESEQRTTSSLLQAIHDELETVMDRYQETMGSFVEALDDGVPLSRFYPVVSNFFTVYDANSALVSRIPDNDLRKQIIKTYTLAKGMVDSYRMNNELLSRYEYANRVYRETQQDVHRAEVAGYYQSLVEYAKSIKDDHRAVKSEANSLLRALRKRGVLSENRS